jgi:16S rRNA U516 pseudouridylate synthase RsuA-like enzyme
MIAILALSTVAIQHTTYAIYKPRNVVSAAGVVNTGRKNYPTLTDVMVAAGVDPLAGHVGRLDAETSGLILVTNDSLLLRGVLGWKGVLEAYGGAPVTKRYELLVAGKHSPNSEALQSLGEPLTHSRGGETYHSEAALAVVHKGSFKDDELAAGGFQLIDRVDAPERLEAERRKLLATLSPKTSRATGQVVPAWVPFEGWCTRVELTLKQGRHHQIRRLCRRAELKLWHLRRISVGPISLCDMQAGDVRTLDRKEVAMLCNLCLPDRES